MKNTALSILILILLIACAPRLEQEPSPQQIMIQCRDGSIVASEDLCPVLVAPSEERIIQEPIPPKEVAAEEPSTVEPKNMMEEWLSNIPETYWFWDEDASLGAIVSGAQRRFIITFYEGDRIAGWGAADAYWNTQTGDVIVYGGELNDACLEDTGGKPTDLYYRAKEGEFVDVYYRTRFSKEELPRGPVDWMAEYRYEQPIEIRETSEVIKTPLSRAYATTDYSIRFNKKGAEGYYVFKISSKWGVPLMIEDHYDTKTVKRYKFEFDTISHASFDRQPLDKLVHVDFSDKIIITEQKFLELSGNRWCTPDY